MQADKLEGGGASSSADFVVHSYNGDRENGDRYSSASHRRRRSRSRDREEDRDRKARRHDDTDDRRSSRRYDDDRRSSRRDDDADRRRTRDRDYRGGDRDRDYRDRDRTRDRDWDRDRRRDPPRGKDRDNADRDRAGRDGRGAGVEVFGAGNAARSPTPEGTIPISKRKRTKTAWDIKAPGFETFNAMQAKMTGIFNLPGQARPMAGYTSMSQDAPLPEIHLGATGEMSSLNGGAAYARQARRLYVGNITPQANESNIGLFFNEQMRNKGWAIDDDPAGVQGPDPVVSVQVNHEKSYAFVEVCHEAIAVASIKLNLLLPKFRSANEATKALGFDGIVFQDEVLKLRRPKDYVGNEFGGPGGHIPGVVSTNVPDTPNKIFIGGLPSYLNDVQVMELLQSFGELRSFNLVKESSTNMSKGFAFCEYVDPSVTDIACQGLNGMELGDRYLAVQRASIGANPAKQGVYGNAAAPAPGPDLNKVSANVIAAATAGEAVPTRVLQMLNMVVQEELVDAEEYEEIVEDIKEECSKYGSVLEVKVPRPVVGENKKIDFKATEALEDVGKVFIMFESVDMTKKAMMSLAGRQFGGRSIICAYADEGKMV